MQNGCVRDSHIDKRMKQVFIRPSDFVTGATASGSAQGATLTAGYTLGANMPTPLWWVGNYRNSVPCLRFSSTTATVTYVWRPWDMDNAHPVYCRFWWTSDSANANVATFSVHYSTLSNGLIMATPTTALTRVVPSVAKDAAVQEPVFTNLGMIAPLSTGAQAFQTFSPEIQAVNFAFHVSTLSNGAIATDFVHLLGMELLYTSKDTFGDGSRRQARYLPVILENQEADPTNDVKGV